MDYTDLGSVETTMKMRLEDAQHWAESQNLLRQAGLAQQGWLSCQICRFLGRLGCQLVEWGEFLEQHSMPQVSS